MSKWITLFVLVFSIAAFAQEAPRGTLRSGEATLFDRSKHKSYGRATFSFEHGIRDDPGLRLTRNDWDLLFQAGRFRVNTIGDDRSRIADLGAKKLSEVDALPELPAVDTNPNGIVAAHEGHVYLVRTQDRDTDLMALFRVRKLVPNDRVEIEWVRWEADGNRKPLALDAATKDRLSRLLDGARAAERAAERERIGVLEDPEAIRLQIRTGAQGGNRSRLSLARTAYRLPDHPSTESLDFIAEPNSRDEPSWYWRGGYIPDGKALVIDAIDIFARAPGDSNGGGEAKVVIADDTVFELKNSDGPYRIWFEGKAVVRPGDEHQLVVECANSSAIDVRIVAHFVPLAEAAAIKKMKFEPTEAPKRIERVGAGVDNAQTWHMTLPRVVLQLRAGAGGGNPNTINMLGKASMYVDRVSSKPLSFEKPVMMGDDAVAYCQGGCIPRGKIFRVTRVEYRGGARGDSNGPGAFMLRVGDEIILKERNKRQPIQGVWEGQIDLRSGDEDKVFIHVANSSTADVTISGEFIDSPKPAADAGAK